MAVSQTLISGFCPLANYTFKGYSWEEEKVKNDFYSYSYSSLRKNIPEFCLCFYAKKVPSRSLLYIFPSLSRKKRKKARKNLLSSRQCLPSHENDLISVSVQKKLLSSIPQPYLPPFPKNPWILIQEKRVKCRKWERRRSNFNSAIIRHVFFTRGIYTVIWRYYTRRETRLFVDIPRPKGRPDPTT